VSNAEGPNLNRLSEQQWEQADKSKIKEWDDDEWD